MPEQISDELRRILGLDEDVSPPKLPPAQIPVFEEWLRAAKEAPPVLFVGAGLSLPSNVRLKPGWKQHFEREPACQDWPGMVADFAKAVGMPDEQGGAKRRASDYLRIAQYYTENFERGRLQAAVERAVPDKYILPGPVHETLAAVPWRSILTTNYDTLLERGIESVGRGPVRVISRDLDLARPRSPGTELEVVHLHGTIDLPDSIVLTEEHYERYPKQHPALVAKVRQLFSEHPILTVGFGLDDPNFAAWNAWIRDLFEGAQPLVLSVHLEDLDRNAGAYWKRRGVHIAAIGKDDPEKQLVALFRYVALRLRTSEDVTWDLENALRREPGAKEIGARAYRAASDKGKGSQFENGLPALESLLSLLEEHLISSDQRGRVWQGFMGACLTASHSELAARLEHPSAEQQAFVARMDEALDGKTAAAQPPAGLVSAKAFELILDALGAKSAAKWMHLGIRYVGLTAEFWPHKGYDEANLSEASQQEIHSVHLGPQQSNDIAIEKIRRLFDEEELAAARTLVEQRAHEFTDDQKQRLTHIERVAESRGGKPPKSSDGASATVCNVVGSNQLMHGRYDAARSSFRSAMDQARASRELLAEWVAIRGLLESGHPTDEGDLTIDERRRRKAEDKSLERRRDRLERETPVRRFLDRQNMTWLKWSEQLFDAVEDELRRELDSFSGSGMRSADTTELIELLDLQETCGTLPADRARTATLLGRAHLRQQPAAKKVIEILLRYGSEEVARQLELYPLWKYAPERSVELFATLTSDGTTASEWYAKLLAIRVVTSAAPTDAVERIKSFVVKAAPRLDGSDADDVGVIGVAAWSIGEKLAAAIVDVARVAENGMSWLVETTEKAPDSLAPAIEDSSHRAPWRHWLAAATADELKLADTWASRLKKRLRSRSFHPRHDNFYISCMHFCDAARVAKVQRSDIDELSAALREALLSVVESGRSGNISDRLLRPAIGYLVAAREPQLAKRVTDSLVQQFTDELASSLKSKKLDAISRLAGVASGLLPPTVLGVLEFSQRLLADPKVARDANAIAIFAADVLNADFDETVKNRARACLMASMSKNEEAILNAARVNTDGLAQELPKVSDEISKRLEGAVSGSSSRSSPWRHDDSDNEQQEVRVTALWSLRNWCLTGRKMLSSWYWEVRALVNGEDLRLGQLAILVLGAAAADERLPSEVSIEEVHALLKRQLDRPEPMIRETASYWERRVSFAAREVAAKPAPHGPQYASSVAAAKQGEMDARKELEDDFE